MNVDGFSILAIPVTLSASFLVYYLLGNRRSAQKSPLPHPPGPPGSWRYGSKLPVDTAERVKVLEEWRRQYGPVITIKREYGKSEIFLCDYQSSTSILDKEGAITSDRPRFIAVGELLCGGLCLSLMRTGQTHNKYRKGFHAGLQPKVMSDYAPILDMYARTFIKDILNDPRGHMEHSWNFSANSVIHVTYGIGSEPLLQSSAHLKSRNQIIDQIQLISSRFINSLRPYAYLVDTFPILLKLPSWLYRPRIQLEKWRDEERDCYVSLMNGVKDGVASSGSKSSANEEAKNTFTSRLLQRQAEIGLTDDEAAYIAGGLFGAGSHSTSAAISWVIMAAALHPQAQKQVQKQIEEVIGWDRCPTVMDEALLPLVTAFYLESYRWRPVTNGGFPHRFTKDVFWNGYIIPEGSIVWGNHWMIGRDEDVFHHPEDFDPMRWIVVEYDETTGKTKMKLRSDIKTVGFGFGRRICPGMHLANKALFISTALLLWTFEISQDPSQPIDSMDFEPGINIRPNPFWPKFDLRLGESSKIESLLF